ncbi:MAG: ribosome small subunit-dependent GTPase A [Clostridia bacterium]|nr:ribosome small subunit-dependent GTPase A [Clostridia bacterium]
MNYIGYGRVIKGVGGLFTVRMRACASEQEHAPLDGATIVARGRGALHRKGSLLVGDLVRVGYDDRSFAKDAEGRILPSPDGSGVIIEEICPRSCALIRPPMANLDVIFVTLAVTKPAPDPETVDKLIAIAEFNHIEPVIVITKSELDPDQATRFAALYRRAGFEAFCLGREIEDDIEGIRTYIETRLQGKIAAFSGASGVGKSTLLNRLFPSLGLEMGEISHRIERGKNTTRSVELYPITDGEDCGYLADTPGFTMLDFERFDFFEKDELVDTFREFAPYIGNCRYKKCTHTKEEGCAILEAVKHGEIAPSRHKSFLSLYEVLKKKTKW